MNGADEPVEISTGWRRRTGNRRCSASTGRRSTVSTKPTTASATGRRCAPPRLLGYTLNPLSVYFCYRVRGELTLRIYEVRNTSGYIHAYILPVKSGDINDAGVRQQQDKLFYGSPFIEMAMRYHFRVLPPDQRVQLRIWKPTAGPRSPQPSMAAGAHLNTKELLRAFFALPLVTLKIMAGNPPGGATALRKGARLVPRTGVPSIPAWRLGKATVILRRRCPPAPRLKQGRSAMQSLGRPPFDGSPMPELISVTSETVDAMFPELPRLVRLALGFGSKLQHGTLDVTLADGRIVRLGGNGPGPAAAMKIYDYGFASRLLRGGDIGIAEAYLRGEWDTPDLTQFLYLFCVNQDWM